MASGIYATPDIGNAGSEFAQLNPTAADTSQVPTTLSLASQALPNVLSGAKGIYDFGKFQNLKSNAQDLITQIQNGMNNDAAVQNAVSTLGEYRSAIAQGTISNNYALIKGKALLNQTKGMSPVYADELDQVFANAGIDPSGRNALGAKAQTAQQMQLEEDYKTVSSWYDDPNSSMFIVYKDGMPQTRDNVDVQASIENAHKMQVGHSALLSGIDDGDFKAMQGIESVFSNMIMNSSQKLTTLRNQAGGDVGKEAEAQQQIINGIVGQGSAYVAQLMKIQTAYPPGNKGYNNIQSVISNLQSQLNQFGKIGDKTDPLSLVAVTNAAKYVNANLTIAQDNQNLNMLQNFGGYMQLSKELPAVFQDPTLGDAYIKNIVNKKNSGTQLSPVEQHVYDVIAANDPAFLGQYLNNGINNARSAAQDGINTPPSSDQDMAQQGFITRLLHNSLVAWNQGRVKAAFIGQATGGAASMANATKTVFDNVHAYLNNVNRGVVNATPQNQAVSLQQTADPGFISLLDTQPKAQATEVARQAITLASNTIQNVGSNTGLNSAIEAGAKIVLDRRTDTVTVQIPGRGNIPLTAGMNLASAVTGVNTNSQLSQFNLKQTQQNWNLALTTLQNVSRFDPELKGKSKVEIFETYLKNMRIPEDAIEIKD
jgi:hypothetical protein